MPRADSQALEAAVDWGHDHTRLTQAPGRVAVRGTWSAVAPPRTLAWQRRPGTTGDPKGVVFSHRSIYLHSM
ncbi:fatty acid--CoA ligase, partial [Streptomyces prunicolor]